MPLNFTTTDKAGSLGGIKILVYGRAGTGKTTLCGTAPKPIILSAESGLLSLRRVSLPVIEIDEIQDVYDAYNWIVENGQKQGIQTICLDSLSEISEKVLTAAKKKIRDPRHAYGTLIDEMIPLVKAFRDLKGYNVVVTCKETADKNEVTGVVRYGPASPGRSVGPALPYLFDEVFQASIGKDNTGKDYHYLRTSADLTAEAKDRSGVLDAIEYPDLVHIFGKIRGT